MKLLNRIWYQRQKSPCALLPLSFLYRLIIRVRYFFYRCGIFKSHKLPVPVIIVGNITVGGTGKTPLLVALVKLLQQQGFHPGVISRGYGGKAKTWPQAVSADSDPKQVGDEPVLIANNVNVPVFVGRKRTEAAKQLLTRHPSCDVIISDDGLQHYALQRDIEIAVVDGLRRFGNRFCLPAGPLREPMTRLKRVDFVVTNGEPREHEFTVTFNPDRIINLANRNQTTQFTALKHQRIIALAGIGNPDRFFQLLTQQGLLFEERVFPDHHLFQEKDIHCADNEIILMTEKDAVKCVSFANPKCWYMTGTAVIDAKFEALLIEAVLTRVASA